jgi:DNA-binding NarL/FixJ family response regulator
VKKPIEKIMAKVALNLDALELTGQEIDIVLATVSGDSEKAIARKLSMSRGALRRSMMEVFDKLGVQNRLELVLFAAYHGIAKTKPCQARGIAKATQIKRIKIPA